MKDAKAYLRYIDPASLSYHDWIKVGMALHQEGLPCSVWDEWSQHDSRYEAGICEKKWASFGKSEATVTGGTLYHFAKEGGYSTEADYTPLPWDAVIDFDAVQIVDKTWLEGKDIVEPRGKWDQAGEIIQYLETLFQPDDYVGYVMQSMADKRGKFVPANGGVWTKTAQELIDHLRHYGNDIGASFGDYDPQGGAWIRINPLNGQGARDQNVTDFRYTLIECDKIDVGKQRAIYQELQLPIAALVHSGNHSLHAIVRVDAMSFSDYRRRVEYLYTVCQKNGLELDTNNKNPSRLSRLPGVMRGGKKQFLLETNTGLPSFEAWKEWIETVNDDLPDPFSLEAVWEAPPPLAPPLIDGLLRQGHKMLVAGPSKAGKSYALIQLAIAIAEGTAWLGNPDWVCSQGKVLYVNLEVDGASCIHRFMDVYQALGLPPRHIQNISIWNLRGKSVPMDKLSPKLIRRALKSNYQAVIIDPIYKVITGDENSASDMARFCNEFDRVCTELGSAVIYCHHHSKGAQGAKRSADRASGSGVFARDPDCLLDFLELEIPSEIRDDSSQTAWRVSGTLREFPSFDPYNMFFQFPVHVEDSEGYLDRARVAGTPLAPRRKTNKQRGEAETLSAAKRFEEAFDCVAQDGVARGIDIAKQMGVTRQGMEKILNRLNTYEKIDMGLKKPYHVRRK